MASKLTASAVERTSPHDSTVSCRLSGSERGAALPWPGVPAGQFDIIRERVVAGMARAEAKGTKSGKGTKSRKPVGRPAIHPAQRAAIRAAYEAGGVGLRAVAAQLGVGVETVRRCVG